MGAGKAGLLCLYEANKRVKPYGVVVCIEYSKEQYQLVEELNLADIVIQGNGKDPMEIYNKYFVEIAREVDNDKLKVLILDEPTSSLNVEETKILLSNLKAIAETGVSIIFISHRLYEIVDVCHRVTIFRSGRVIKEYKYEIIKEQYELWD